MPITLHIKANHGWDYKRQEFIDIEEQDVEFEHCLLAIARWESKWTKPFFTDNHSMEEWIDYVGFMALDVKDYRFAHSLSQDQIMEVINYMQQSQTATWFSEERNKPNSEQLTSELIYYYMAQVPLPFDICERWNFSRLTTILRIAAIKSQPEKKMSQNQIAAQNKALNAARKAKLKGLHK